MCTIGILVIIKIIFSDLNRTFDGSLVVVIFNFLFIYCGCEVSLIIYSLNNIEESTPHYQPNVRKKSVLGLFYVFLKAFGHIFDDGRTDGLLHDIFEGPSSFFHLSLVLI